MDVEKDQALMRSKTDMFQLTPTGGLFKATTDPNVSIYFPVKSISQTVTVAMQVKFELFSFDSFQRKKNVY